MRLYKSWLTDLRFLLMTGNLRTHDIESELEGWRRVTGTTGILGVLASLDAFLSIWAAKMFLTSNSLSAIIAGLLPLGRSETDLAHSRASFERALFCACRHRRLDCRWWHFHSRPRITFQ